MKVLHIVARLAEGGGIAEAVLGLTRASVQIGNHGCGVLTVAEHGLDPFAARCREAGVSLHTAIPGWRHTLWYSLDWNSQLGQIASDYDVVHLHGLWLYPMLATARWCVRHRMPFVVSPHGSLLSAALAQSGWKKRMLSPWARWAYRQAACVHVTSATEADAVRNFWGDQVPRIVCLPEGVDVGEVTTCESAEVLKLGEAEATSDANRTNSSFVLRPSSFSEDAVRTRTVLYLGRVSPEKNLDMLVDAWVRLPPESRLGWRLRLIGFPPKGQSRYADAWGRKHAVQSDVSLEAFCGVDEKWKALAESDVFVLPSRTENFGIVVAEALACGVPVIATKGTPWSELLGNEGGSEVHYSNSALVGEVGSRKAEVLPINDRMNSRTNELTRPGRAGWWIDVGVEPLVAALREAMRLTDEERQALGESGRSLVEAKYQWPKIAKAMERVYEEIIAVNGNKQ